MKILFITPGCFDKGGISRYSRYQITALRELYGIDHVHVISFLGPDENSFETKFEVSWHGENKGIIERIKLVFIAITYTLTFRPNVIHVAHVNYSGLAKTLSFLVNAKTVLNVYGLEVWTNLKKHAAWGLAKSDYVISDCYSTKDYILENGLRNKADHITVIWDCVDTEIFRPIKNGFENIIKKYDLPDRDNNFIISTLGRMSKDAAYKGYNRLITAFSKVHKKNPNSYLLMIGRGNLLDDLRKQAKDDGVFKNVIFTGSVSDEELPLLLSYGHIFSLVTRSGVGMGEGIPLTPLEAMSCGLPIIVGNEDGSREAVIKKRNGFIINPEDISLQVQIIIALYKDRSKLKEMSNEALNVVEEYFSYSTFKQETTEFYTNL